MKSLKSMVSMKLSLIIQNDARAMIIRNKTTADVHKMMQLLTKAILTHVIWVNMGKHQLLNVKDLPITTLCNYIWQHRILQCHSKVPKYLSHQLIVWNIYFSTRLRTTRLSIFGNSDWWKILIPLHHTIKKVHWIIHFMIRCVNLEALDRIIVFLKK